MIELLVKQENAISICPKNEWREKTAGRNSKLII